MRGENHPRSASPLGTRGTSPRARGKPLLERANNRRTRNIPACAGKTAGNVGTWISEGEHPRVRGENLDDWRQLVGIEGTSPRARGKPGPGAV